MCGIAGVFNTQKKTDELRALGEKFISLLDHRGPDGNGIELFHTSQNSTCLTHNRLSIIDLSSSARQPMSKYDSKLWITFNGEIYNYKEIREELLNKGEVFFSNSDTEVILAAYKVWGTECFNKFIGMWAIAIYDSDENSLILCRDRLGIKPLYYTNTNREIGFGSEPKILLSYNQNLSVLNNDSLSDYFSYRFPLGNKTFYKNIKIIEPGSFIKFTESNYIEKKYWELKVEKDKVDPGKKRITEDLTDLLNSSVKYRMISDVPLGSLLSGGLDSSIIVNEMNQISSSQIRTYNIGFNKDSYNEFSYANEVSSAFNTKHSQILMEDQDYFKSMVDIIKYKDGPLSVPNEVAIHKLSKELKKDITVVLSGEGADEIFGGYGRIFRSAFDFMRVEKLGINKLHGEFKKNIFSKYDKANFKSEIDFFISQYSYIDFETKLQLFTKDFLNSINSDLLNKKFFSNEWKKLNELDLHDKFMHIFQKTHLQGLLGRLDCATMSSSVEGRVPFVDHRLVEYMNKIPLKYKIRFNKNSASIYDKLNSDQISENYDTTKYILREIYKNKLPTNIIGRKKVGFPVPLNEWLLNNQNKYTEKLFENDAKTINIFNQSFLLDLVNARTFNRNSGLLVWMALNVEEWMREYNISIH